MSAWFERIKRFYNTFDRNGNRLWDINRVRDAVRTGTITEAEYEEITGEVYAE